VTLLKNGSAKISIIFQIMQDFSKNKISKIFKNFICLQFERLLLQICYNSSKRGMRVCPNNYKILNFSTFNGRLLFV